jgi:hypothetical protein
MLGTSYRNSNVFRFENVCCVLKIITAHKFHVKSSCSICIVFRKYNSRIIAEMYRKINYLSLLKKHRMASWISVSYSGYYEERIAERVWCGCGWYSPV